MTKQDRKHISALLGEISRCYWNTIPVGKIDEVLRKFDYKLVQEDNTDFEGFFIGENSRANINVADMNGNVEPFWLCLSWYKMHSGRFEINAYLS